MPAPEFIALADVLRAPPAPPVIAAVEPEPPALEVAPCGDVAAAVREARLFRARLADAFDDALAGLVRELACSVLARELAVAPCDLAALARRVIEGAPVVRVRVAPEDESVAFGVPAVVDPALDAGDVVFELHGGALDARLGVRLAHALESAR